MKEELKVDNYFNNGNFEMMQVDNVVMMKNIMTEKKHYRYKKNAKKRAPKLKKRIDKKIKRLRNLIIECNPIELLKFSYNTFFEAMLGKSSEFQYSFDDIKNSRLIEYLQSVLVSSENKYTLKNREKDQSKAYYKIRNLFGKIYLDINIFYIYNSFLLKEIYSDLDAIVIDNIVEAQMLYGTRGKRYQYFEMDYFSHLLFPHNKIFSDLYDMSSNDVLEGLKKLQHSISQGYCEGFNELADAYQDFLNQVENGINLDEYKAENEDNRKKINEKLFGTSLNNVIEVTSWDSRFVNTLALSINENNTFFSEGEYAGWPVVDLPVQKKPFIKIEEDYYCFDYYSLFDNFYRIMQKSITRTVPEYNWSDIQKEASESMVESIIKEILPGCNTYRDNYYPKSQSLKQCNENDLIVIYKNALLIMEVKAGSFVYTAPMTDFDAHIKSYKSLIEKADDQCTRTHQYLCKNSVATLYDENKQKKCDINMENIDYIYNISITIDNINEFAAKADKLAFLNLQSKAISMSIDDLQIYNNYFETPLKFMHFLEQRSIACTQAELALNDELDHLGMYIKHNCYPLYASSNNHGQRMFWVGYREELDNYFSSLYHPHLNYDKPVQQIPHRIDEIIECLKTMDIDNCLNLSNYLLSFSSESKEDLNNRIEYVLIRQKQINGMTAITSIGDELRYTVFVHQPDIRIMQVKERTDYVSSIMLNNQEINRIMIELFYDSSKMLYNVCFCTKYTKNIPFYDIPRLKNLIKRHT